MREGLGRSDDKRERKIHTSGPSGTERLDPHVLAADDSPKSPTWSRECGPPPKRRKSPGASASPGASSGVVSY